MAPITPASNNRTTLNITIITQILSANIALCHTPSLTSGASNLIICFSTGYAELCKNDIFENVKFKNCLEEHQVFIKCCHV